MTAVEERNNVHKSFTFPTKTPHPKNFQILIRLTSSAHFRIVQKMNYRKFNRKIMLTSELPIYSRLYNDCCESYLLFLIKV